MRIHPGIIAALLISVLCLSVKAEGQAYTYHSHIEHPIVLYRMSARLDPATKIVKGHYTLTWWNHTSDTIPDLYFHLYLNAFKNLDSTFMRESGERRRGEAENQAKGADRWGWVDVDKIQIAGGSDLTATLLARALGASSVTLWKDVPGVLTADPRVVPDARLIPRVHVNLAAGPGVQGRTRSPERGVAHQTQ